MEGALPAIEHLGHRQLYGNLTLDRSKSNWKAKRGSGGLAVNTSEGCWRRSGKSLFVVCRTMKRCLWMCCEHVEGNVTYPRQIQGKVLHFSLTGCLQYFQVFKMGAVCQGCSLLQSRRGRRALADQRRGSHGMGALYDPWKSLAFVVFSSKQQTIASLYSAVQDGRQPHLP